MPVSCWVLTILCVEPQLIAERANHPEQASCPYQGEDTPRQTGQPKQWLNRDYYMILLLLLYDNYTTVLLITILYILNITILHNDNDITKREWYKIKQEKCMYLSLKCVYFEKYIFQKTFWKLSVLAAVYKLCCKS